MKTYVLLVVAMLAGWLSSSSAAQACSCLPPDLGRSYGYADHVLHVRVQGAVAQSPSTRLFTAVLLEDDYKGCLKARQRVLIETPASSAACGMNLSRGEYLLHAKKVGSSMGLPRLAVGSCDYNVRWRALSADDRAYLDTRYVCCGDSCACADGSEPVNCFVDPCDVASCDVEGAVCHSNYCGGCNAEWRDESGAAVCQDVSPACDYDDPARRYVARSPEQCQLVRFTCEPGLAPFFDDCGCGCEQLTDPACKRNGCSGQICSPVDARPIITTCEFRPEYACLRAARCEPQADGVCGLTETPELASCLADAGGPAR